MLKNVLGGIASDLLNSPQGANASSAVSLLSALGGGNANQSLDVGALLGDVLSNKGANKQALIAAILPLVLQFIQQHGGVQGAYRALTSATTGNTLTAQETGKLFDDHQIERACQDCNQDKQTVQSGLSELLPKVLGVMRSQSLNPGALSGLISALKR